MQLTAREWDRLASALECQIRQLIKTGDFPERAEYEAIAKKARAGWAEATVREVKRA